MQYNDTSGKQGLIQEFEFWTGVGDGTVSGDATFLKNVTRLMNVRYAKVLARLQLLTGIDGAEDTNYTNQQFSYFDIASGTGNYQFLTDASGNTITDITGVLILPSATSTEYVVLDKLTLDAPHAHLIMSPNPSMVGIPSGFIEKNNTVFFDVVPMQSSPATSGGLSYSWNSIKATATSIKGSAGQVYGRYIYNNNSSVMYVQFFNTASGSVTLGTTTPVYSIGIPATSGANVFIPQGIAHSTAITIAATTTATGSSNPTNNVDINIFFK